MPNQYGHRVYGHKKNNYRRKSFHGLVEANGFSHIRNIFNHGGTPAVSDT